MTICAKCGKLIESEAAAFCATCGAKIERVIAIEATRAKNRFAYAMTIVLVLYSAAQAFAPEWSNGLAVGTSLLLLGCLVADWSTNTAYEEMGWWRIVALIVAIPLWLWFRGRVFHTTRAPFWAFLAALIIGTMSVDAVQSGRLRWDAAEQEPGRSGRAATSGDRSSTTGAAAGDAVPSREAPAASDSMATGESASSSPLSPPAVEESAPAPVPGAWVVRAGLNRMTDEETIVAQSHVSWSSDSPYIYELTLTCTKQQRQLTLGTFEAGGSVPRNLPYDVKALNPGGSDPMYSEVLEVRFRVDDQPQRRALLEPEYSNVAKWQSATDLGGAMRQGALALQGYSAFDELPTRRLLIADAFPGEVVEFSFETMALDEWSAVQRFCFLPRSTDEAADAEEGH